LVFVIGRFKEEYRMKVLLPSKLDRHCLALF
jgi:hypothetical protein